MRKYRLIKVHDYYFQYRIQRNFGVFGWWSVKSFSAQDEKEATMLFNRYVKTSSLHELIISS